MNYEYSPHRLPPGESEKEVLATLISAVIGNMVLPGSKIIVASRPSKK